MKLNDTVEHEGIVKENTGSIVKVIIHRSSACANCEGKKGCYLSENSNKIIDVTALDSDYRSGEKVKVVLERKLAINALFYAYILPFIVVIITLFLISAMTGDERLAGIISISVLVPYFLILKAFKSKFERKYSFKLERMIH